MLQVPLAMVCLRWAAFHHLGSSVDEHVRGRRPPERSLGSSKLLAKVGHCEHQRLLRAKSSVLGDAIVHVFRICDSQDVLGGSAWLVGIYGTY